MCAFEMACCHNVKISSYCFCFSLRTGVKIIGFFVLLGGIQSLGINLFGSFFAFDDPPSSTYHEETTEHPFAGINQQSQIKASSKEGAVASPIIEMVIVGIILLLDLVTIAVAIVLLVGAFMMKPPLLKTFCVAALVLVLLKLIFKIPDNVVNGFNPGTDMAVYLNFLLNLYWILVVRSAYYEMKDELVGQRRPGEKVYSHNDNTEMHQLKPLNP